MFSEKMMKCGAHKAEITPKPEFGDIYIAGYATMEAPLVDGVHDPIHARTLVLSDGNERVVLVSVEVVGLLQDEINKIKDDLEGLGFKRSRIFVLATHTHAGPDTMGMWGPFIGKSGVNLRYMLFLRQQVVASVTQALKDMKPVDVSYGEKKISNLIQNFRPVKNVEDTLQLIQFKYEENIIGCIWTFPAQPEITNRENVQISGDYPGIICNIIEEKNGGVSLFGLGLCGSQSPIYVEQGYEKLELMVNEVYKGFEEAQRISERVEADQLEIRTRKIDLQLENADFALLQTLSIFNLPEVKEGIIGSSVSKIRIGNLHLITIPGEPFPGLINPLLKKYANEKFVILSHVNDSCGYFIPRNEWNLAPVEFLKPEKKEEFVGHENESMGLKASETVQEAVRDILKYQKVMAVSPHADDISIFSGGLLAKFAEEGNKVICVRVTDDYGDCVGLKPEKAIKRNRNEAEKAYKALGAEEVIHLDHPSDTLYTVDYEVLREQFVRLIRTHKPDVIVTFDVAPLYEENPDHIITARAVNDACWQASFDTYYTEHFNDGLEIHTVGERYLFSETLNPQVVNSHLDITEYIEKKINAVSQHQTVMKNWFHQRKLLARANQLRVDLLEEEIPDPIRVNILVRFYYSEIGASFGVKYGEIFRKLDAGFLNDLGNPI
ncbi:MAG: PIG-L family deacetylase [Promethearchaeota archaeon]|nr:MAG: PIG-L family deacetylase [Candidatus Lokiarchaeota archaeon]